MLGLSSVSNKQEMDADAVAYSVYMYLPLHAVHLNSACARSTRLEIVIKNDQPLKN